jgi:hypothetical protein
MTNMPGLPLNTPSETKFTSSQQISSLIDPLGNFPINAMAHLRYSRKWESLHTNSNSPKPGLPSILFSTSLTFLHTNQQNIAISKILQSAKYHNQQKPPSPPPVDVEGEPEYNVRGIHDSKRYRGKIKYLVHWEGYPTEEDTWEPTEEVKNAQELIEQFHQDYLDKPAPPMRQIRVIDREEEPEDFTKYLQLYDYVNGIPGEGFRKPNRPLNLDVIIPLTPHQADNLLCQLLDPLPRLLRQI